MYGRKKMTLVCRTQWNSRVTQNHHKSFDFCDTRRRRPYILTNVVPAKTEQRTWYRAIKPYLVSCADIAEARQSSADQRAYAHVSILDAELISEERTWDQSGSGRSEKGQTREAAAACVLSRSAFGTMYMSQQPLFGVSVPGRVEITHQSKPRLSDMSSRS